MAESARWGDDNKNPPLTLAEWMSERDLILTNYLPQRTALSCSNSWRTDFIRPSPRPFSASSAAVCPPVTAFDNAQTNGAVVIYYTTDGSDPRVPGHGAVSSTALAYFGIPSIINAPMLVRARVS